MGILKKETLFNHSVTTISLALNVVAVILVFARLHHPYLWTYTWSDTLYLPAIFQDVFIDKSGFSGWNLNGAPNFFPDMLIYFIIRSFTINFLQASFLFSILQVSFIVVLGYQIYKQLLPKAQPLLLSISMLAMLIFLYVALIRGNFTYTFYLLSITFHTGSYVMMLLALYLTLLLLKTNKTQLYILLFVVLLVAGICDKLFFLQYTIPMFTALVFFAFLKQYRKQSIIMGLLILISLSASVIIYNSLRWSGAIDIITISNKVMVWENVHSSYEVLINQHLGYFKEWDIRGVIDALVLISFVCSAYILIRKLWALRKSERLSMYSMIEIVYLIYIVVHTVLVFNAPAINGYYPSRAVMRFNIYPLYFNLINYTYLFYKVSAYYQKPIIAKASGATVLLVNCIIVLVIFTKTPVKQGVKNYINYYPKVVSHIDSIAEEYKLTYGISNYQLAKYTTMFSKTGLRIYHTHANLRPWHHMTNSNWYYGSDRGMHKDPRFNFIILEDMNPEIAFELFNGHITDTLYSEEADLDILLTDPFIFDKETKNPIFIID